jgi:hypothetical protein
MVRARADLVETELGVEISIYDPAFERVTLLNATAADIWRLLDGDLDLAGIVDLLASAYATEPGRIRPDVEATVAMLADAGLLEP